MLTIQPDPDPDSMFLSIFFIVILVMLSGFLSGTETAFSSVNRTKLKIKAQDGNKAAANALKLSENYDKLLSAILVGNNLVNITLSVLFNNLFESLIPNPAVCGVVSVASEIRYSSSIISSVNVCPFALIVTEFKSVST